MSDMFQALLDGMGVNSQGSKGVGSRLSISLSTCHGLSPRVDETFHCQPFKMVGADTGNHSGIP